jgi:hypothetical protein
MCDPLTIAGIALTAGSEVANYSANQRATSARNSALSAERLRQQKYQQQAAALNLTSQNRYEDFGGQEDQKAKQLGDYFTAQSTSPAPGAAGGPPAADAMPASTSNIAVQEEAKQRGQATAFTDASAKALGNLRSFGDLLGGIGRSQARDAGQIAQIGNFETGSSGVLPYELDAAGHSGDGTKTFADILGGLGSMATGAGLSGANIFGLGGNAAGGAVNAAKTAGLVSVPGFPLGNQGALRLGSIYGGWA